MNRWEWLVENVPEGVSIHSLPRSTRWKAYLLFPCAAWSVYKVWFRLATPLPGDRFYSFHTDNYVEVYAVDHRNVTLELRSHQLHERLGRDWDKRAVDEPRMFMTIPRREFRRSAWMVKA